MSRILESRRRPSRRALSIAAALVLVWTNAAPADAVFRSPMPVPLSHPAAAFVVEDLNGDGVSDAAAVGQEKKVLSVVLGAGGGRFLAPVEHATGNGPVAVLAGDFDRASGPDLFVINSGSSSVSVYLNLGGGSFREPTSTAVGLSPRSGRLADFDQDGDLDAVVTNLASFDMHVLLGDGRGGFAASHRLQVGDNPHFVVVGDFDGDRILDVAVARRDDRLSTGAVSWFPGLGDGRFGAGIETPLAAQRAVPRLLAASDYDQDGDLDLAAFTSDSKLLVLLNSGRGGFEVLPAGAATGVRADFFSGFLLSLDVDGDRIVDLVTPQERGGDPGIRVHRGDGRGGFEGFDLHLDAEAEALAFADLNGDGLADALVAYAGAAGLALLPGRAGGAFETRSVAPLEASPRALARLDLDRDGREELVALDSQALHAVDLPLSGRQPLPRRLRDFPGAAFQDLAAADLDRDGAEDLALVDLNGRVLVLASGGDLSVDLDPATLPSRVAAGDLDGDGYTDLVLAHQAAGALLSLRGPGRREAGFPERSAIDLGSAQSAIALADASGDGAPDLAASTRQGTVLLVNDGRGAFSERRRWDVYASASGLRFASLLGGPGMDLCFPFKDRLVVLPDVFADLAAEPREFPIGGEVRPIDVADLDGDGLLDVLIGGAQHLHVLLGDGGGFQPPQSFRIGVAPRALLAGDFDGDGALDAASADGGSRAVSITLGLGPPENEFRRGDADGRGGLQITDAIAILGYLYLGQAEPDCLDAADANDDGGIGLVDAVRVLDYLYRGGAPLPAPGALECGPDPTADALKPCRRESCR